MRLEGRTSQQAYSLLEVLVALVIIALAAGVVAPALTSSLGSATRHAARLSLEQRVLELRRAAVTDQAVYRLGAPSQEEIDVAANANQIGRRPRLPVDEVRDGRLDLPSGWRYEGAPSVVFRPDGGCSEGQIKLIDDKGREVGRYQIAPPRCRPEK